MGRTMGWASCGYVFVTASSVAACGALVACTTETIVEKRVALDLTNDFSE